MLCTVDSGAFEARIRRSAASLVATHRQHIITTDGSHILSIAATHPQAAPSKTTVLESDASIDALDVNATGLLSLIVSDCAATHHRLIVKPSVSTFTSASYVPPRCMFARLDSSLTSVLQPATTIRQWLATSMAPYSASDLGILLPLAQQITVAYYHHHCCCSYRHVTHPLYVKIRSKTTVMLVEVAVHSDSIEIQSSCNVSLDALKSNEVCHPTSLCITSMH
jgi:hypothetical protein